MARFIVVTVFWDSFFWDDRLPQGSVLLKIGSSSVSFSSVWFSWSCVDVAPCGRGAVPGFENT
jgi:hypothetical protein